MELKCALDKRRNPEQALGHKDQEKMKKERERIGPAEDHRSIWLSDIHLNFADSVMLTRFAEMIELEKADSVLISGDIAESTDLVHYLEFLEQSVKTPIYFVLGNHDYHQGSVQGVRRAVSELVARTSGLTYLTQAGVIKLSEKTALIGHDGWADGRLGDYDGSEVILNDYFLIEEFAQNAIVENEIPLLPKSDRLSVMQSLAREATEHLANTLPRALQTYEHVVVVTHVPPFQEACWYGGKMSNSDYLPHFACQAVGEVLLKTMEEHQNKRMTVLCGHTHGEGETMIRPNLQVLTAGAEYTQPKIQRILRIE